MKLIELWYHHNVSQLTWSSQIWYWYVVQSLSCVWFFVTELQHTRLLCPSLSCSLLKLVSIELVIPSNHLILSRPFLLMPSIFPSIKVFSTESILPIRWPCTGTSAIASVLPMNIQDWFPLGLTGLISFLSKGLSRVFTTTTVQKHQFFGAQHSLWSSSHICTWLLEKP